MEMTETRSLYSGARGIAVKILNRIERSDAYLDKILDAELKSDEISRLDKSLLTELVHGVLRWQGRIDWIIYRFTHGNFAKSESNVKNALRVAVYQILFLDRIPHHAIVNEAVEFIKRIRGEKLANFVNAVLRNIIKSIENLPYPKKDEDPVQFLSVYYSHPQWIVKRWLNRYPFDDVEKHLIANNEIPPITLRINKLKIEPRQFLSLLDEQNIQYQGSSFIDYFIKVKSFSGITQLDIFQKGYFSIQDESAALPVLLLQVQPGDHVIDLCAAPGGKTTFIGELLRNTGSITAVDKYEYKLQLIKNSCERLGIQNVQFVVGDAAEFSATSANKILLDVPCSGLGVLRKKPDLKWRREPEDIEKLCTLQYNLLKRAASILKPGGVIVYSTCTTEPEENELLIDRFLNEHKEFKIDDASNYVNKSVVTKQGYIMSFPHRHHIDGSFAVRLVKD